MESSKLKKEGKNVTKSFHKPPKPHK